MIRPPHTNSHVHWGAALQGLLLFLLVSLVYLPVLRCGFIWDDDSYVTENSVIMESGGLRRIWFEPLATPQYYPLVHSTFWIEYRLWGLNPAGFHVVNVLLHAMTCVVIWRTLRVLNVPGAWLAAAMFGVHPVHVESVAWITERKNILSGLCYITAMYTALPLLKLDDRHTSQNISIRRYLIATLLFTGALLSKSVTCSLPAACLLLVFWKRGRVAWREVFLMVPWFAFGLAAAMQTTWLERTHVGASGSVFSWTLVERCWIAGHAVWFYLGKLLWPNPLVFFYPRWSINTQLLSSWIGPFTAVLLPIVLWFARNQIGRGPLVAALYFGGTLLPALGFVNVYPMRYSFVADHFQYLASLGPIVLFAACLTSAASRKTEQIGWPTIATYLLLVPLSIICWRQQAVYRDTEALWTDTLLKNPDNFVAHARLGTVRAEQGRLSEATFHFRESLRLQTDETESHITLRLLGNSLARQRLFADAEESLNEALRLRPDEFSTIYELATLAVRQQQHPKAIDLFRQALLLEGNNALPKSTEVIVRMNLGNSLAAIGELDAAAIEYKKILRLKSDQVDAQVNLANIFARQARYHEAEQLYGEVLKRQPNHPQARANIVKVRSAILRGEPPASGH